MLRVATFNMESFGDDRFDADRLAPRIAALRPRLLELDADILCLQEVNGQKRKGQKQRRLLALDSLLDGTPYAGFHLAHSTLPPREGPGDRHNLVVLSKYPILETRSLDQAHVTAPLWRPSHAEPPAAKAERITFDRPILHCAINIGSAQPLHVFVVHLRAPIAANIPGGKQSALVWRTVDAWAEGYFVAAVKRTAQALDLRLAVDRVFDADPDAFILLAGDFNATADTSALRLLCADPDDTGNPGLAARRLWQIDARLPLNARRTVIHKGKGQALDHILASPRLNRRVQSVKVFNSGLADEVLDAGTDAEDGSFHAAMCATFDL